MNNKVEKLVENLDLILMNTTFTEEDVDRSDVGTFYLSEAGLKKVKESLALADLALIDRKQLPNIYKGTGYIPLAEALKEVEL